MKLLFEITIDSIALEMAIALAMTIGSIQMASFYNIGQYLELEHLHFHLMKNCSQLELELEHSY